MDIINTINKIANCKSQQFTILKYNKKCLHNLYKILLSYKLNKYTALNNIKNKCFIYKIPIKLLLELYSSNNCDSIQNNNWN